jgi:hypothetical protein
MLILSRPTPGRDAQYNEWYQSVHLPQMLALKGFKSGRRLRHAATLGDRDSYPYAAIYEIETDDLDAVLKDIYRESASGRLLIDESLDRQNIYAAVYEEIS